MILDFTLPVFMPLSLAVPAVKVTGTTAGEAGVVVEEEEAGGGARLFSGLTRMLGQVLDCRGLAHPLSQEHDNGFEGFHIGL